MKKLFYCFIVFLFSCCLADTARAIDFTPPPFNDLNYQGAFVSQSVADPITIEAGASKEIIVKIKNTGEATWYPTGANYVSVYTVNPNYRASVFASSNWLSKSQPAKISAVTKPGAVAEIKIKLTAPLKTGDYTEDFYLAAENSTWIKSSYFYFKIKVTAASAAAQTSVYKFTRDLELGMTGADVKELQKFLNDNGFAVAASGVGSAGHETTLFGAMTKIALAKFQTANKISPASGYFGPITRNLVNKLSTAAAAGSSTNGSEPGDNLGNSAAGEQDESQEANKEYRAGLLVFTSREVVASGGQQVAFSVRYLNEGTVAWNSWLWQEAGSSLSAAASSTDGETVILSDASWINQTKIISRTEAVAPNQPLEFSFYFRLPAKKGDYIARFQLTANGHTLNSGTLELPVKVLSDAPAGYLPPTFSSARVLVEEPKVKIGLYKAETPVDFQSPFIYQVWSGQILMGRLPANETAEMKYYDGLYTFTAPSLTFTARGPLRLAPEGGPGDYFVLTNYDRHVSWKGASNFNMYRGTMEFKYSPKSDLAWVVNELLLDDYIAGIGETSNAAAMEYAKAILVAARSYAYYHINNGLPADQRTFDLYATTADQLYLGYSSELLMPRVVQAAHATAGEVVTYNATPVVTPYFGHSDGRTRTWSQVWGGTDKAWLQSVVCKYDEGRSMYGHGVGMSASDASQRADKDGWTYDQLLKYYYTGVEVERIY